MDQNIFLNQITGDKNDITLHFDIFSEDENF